MSEEKTDIIMLLDWVDDLMIALHKEKMMISKEDHQMLIDLRKKWG